MPSEYSAPGLLSGSEKRRVLVVDDNADSADLIVQLLEIHGHEARSANTASEALVAAREFKPQVAILDVGLPDMPGYELAALLRAIDQLQTCKLIAVTGYSNESETLHRKMADFDMHFVKPVDLQRLAQCVAEASALTSATDG